MRGASDNVTKPLARISTRPRYTFMVLTANKVAYSGTLPSGERYAPFDTTVVSGAYTEIMELSEASMAIPSLSRRRTLNGTVRLTPHAQWIASVPERRRELRIIQRSHLA